MPLILAALHSALERLLGNLVEIDASEYAMQNVGQMVGRYWRGWYEPS
jgi:hypothetical protein